tara:strand:+ start:695 stop:1861 length:1167 start_codon:yes stop_codon:yes gene_type:complete
MKVPFGTLTLTESAKKYVNKALDENSLSQGKLVKEFEEKFAEFAGTEYAVAVNTGTAAIQMALSSLYEVTRARRYSDIIVPALTFVASSNAILQAGFVPKFVDIDINTLNIDIEKIPEKVDEMVAGILPVHLMGKPVDMDSLLSIEHEVDDLPIAIIEDAAEAHGSTLNGKKVGTFGLAGCFSLYVAHIISSIEGGMVVTDSESVADIVRSLRNHGRLDEIYDHKNEIDNRFIFPRVGYSAKMNELEAAVGLGTMESAGEILDIRRENYYYYSKEFEKFSDYFYLVKENENEMIGPHAFPIILRIGSSFSRDEFGSFLQKNDIDSRTLFNSIPTQNEGYRWMGHKRGDFPMAEYVGNHGLHIGVHQGIGKEEREHVIKVTEKFFKEKE